MFHIEIQKRGPSNSAFLQNWFPQEIRSPLFNLSKFWKADKSTAESCRMHWNLMNDEEFGSFKCLILKYRRRDQVIQPFCRTDSPEEIRSLLLNLSKFSKTDKSTAESCTMYWNLMNDEKFGSSKWLISEDNGEKIWAERFWEKPNKIAAGGVGVAVTPPPPPRVSRMMTC